MYWLHMLFNDSLIIVLYIPAFDQVFALTYFNNSWLDRPFLWCRSGLLFEWLAISTGLIRDIFESAKFSIDDTSDIVPKMYVNLKFEKKKWSLI